MKYAILFGGQGYHHEGMFDIIKNSPSAKLYLDQASDFLKLTTAEIEKMVSGEILEDKYAQPLLCTYAYAIWKTIENSIPTPLVFTGFSLGEIAAYGCADSMNFDSLLKISSKRAQYMDEATPDNISVIAVMGITEDIMQELCNRTNTKIMIESAEEHFSIAGFSKDIENLKVIIDKEHHIAEIRDVALKIPSHTPFLSKASELFKVELESVNFATPKVPVLAGINGRLIRNKNAAIRTLSAQISQTVHWHKCYLNAVERGAEFFLEISPGAILTKMVHRESSRFKANSTSSFNSIEGIAKWINKYRI